jgi:CRP-like cAMP-binding protein
MLEGRHLDHLFLLVAGAVVRYKVLPDGRRQVLTLGLPGDFIGFASCPFDVALNSVATLTDPLVAVIAFHRSFEMFHRLPRLGLAVFWSSASDMALYGERLMDLGRRTAYERLAHLMLELHARLSAV